MGIKCKEIASYIESFSPLDIAEEWDNVGLLLGSRNSEITRVLVCLDAKTETIDEAVLKKADLIISHHPFIFKGLKRIDTDSFLGENIKKLLKAGINVYSAHTNLDMAVGGVNECLAQAVGIINTRDIKKYKAEKLFKVVVFVPKDKADELRDAMSSCGAGHIGNYSDCFFSVTGEGTFKPLEGTNPYIGSTGKIEKVEEIRLETVATEKNLHQIIETMKKVHPYEEVAYDIYPINIKGREYGLGKIGELAVEISLTEFVSVVKSKLNTSTVRLIGNTDKKIKKVAVFCGSFDESLIGMIKNQVDILVTGDIKYHTALDLLENGICTIDAGHFNTEFIIVSKLLSMLQNEFPDIKFFGSDVENDPFKYI